MNTELVNRYMNYSDKVTRAVKRCGSVLCLGLDPVPENIPVEIKESTSSTTEAVYQFCREIIQLTSEYIAAIKLNSAYFEALGPDGYQILADLQNHIPEEVVSIIDAKRGDVPHTASRYKVAYFDNLGYDAITLSPLLGNDSLLPFLEDPKKACYILALTSNSGATDYFTQTMQSGITLSEYIARQMNELSANVIGEVGLVIGATHSNYPDRLFHEFAGGHILTPGIGAQQADTKNFISTMNKNKCKTLIPVSRGIMESHINRDVIWRDEVLSSTRQFNNLFQSLAEYHGET